MEALDYDDIVLINAPFTQEIRDMDYIHNLKAKLAEKMQRWWSYGWKHLRRSYMSV